MREKFGSKIEVRIQGWERYRESEEEERRDQRDGGWNKGERDGSLRLAFVY